MTKLVKRQDRMPSKSTESPAEREERLEGTHEAILTAHGYRLVPVDRRAL